MKKTNNYLCVMLAFWVISCILFSGSAFAAEGLPGKTLIDRANELAHNAALATAEIQSVIDRSVALSKSATDAGQAQVAEKAEEIGQRAAEQLKVARGVWQRAEEAAPQVERFVAIGDTASAQAVLEQQKTAVDEIQSVSRALVSEITALVLATTMATTMTTTTTTTTTTTVYGG